ncbi:WGR domain-containing protein [Microvirga sp. Mcv34]|uniref:WGR domain-containing protein n=1 Tax=Microvirga sp. Mcv34 TaxID=2926016 RepID=UPI0021C9F453|nr:WGR domain-containing protein [Microvirga sp. Mcv34]
MPDCKIQYLVLDRCNPDANMARLFVLSVEASLISYAALICEWGRIGTSGHRTIELYNCEGRAVEAVETWLRRRQRRGYVTQHRSPKTDPHTAQTQPLSVGVFDNTPDCWHKLQHEG